MTLTPLLKELKKKVEKYQESLNNDKDSESYPGSLAEYNDWVAFRDLSNTQNILLLIQAIEEMKEALVNITNTKCFWTEETCHHNIADEVLDKYFNEKTE